MSMTKIWIVLAVMLCATFGHAESAPTPQPTPNAAVGYLMALGWMQPITEKVQTELSTCETVAGLDKLSPDARNAIGAGKMGTAVKLLVMGAACDYCMFGYQRTWRPDDVVPPFRRLRELARTARVYGLDQVRQGKAEQAFATFRAIFRLGAHLETDGTLIAGMVGLAFKKLAVKGFEELLNGTKDDKVIADARAFLKAQPKATAVTPSLMEGEKKFIGTALNMLVEGAKKDDSAGLLEAWPDIENLFPKSITDKMGKPAAPTTAQTKSCQANQRVLLAAVEMLGMDYSPMPATLTVAVIPEFLVKEKYLKLFPTCPEGGKYELSQSKEGQFAWRCSKHADVDSAGTEPPVAKATPSAELMTEIKQYLAGPEFAKLTAEALAVIDEAKTLDPYAPDFATKIEAYSKKIKDSPNPIINSAVPNVRKVFESQKELDEAMLKLIGK